MLTIATYWIAFSYVIAVGLAVDQLRRPLPEWEAAGRDRRFWLALTLILGFHGLGQYAAIGYFAAVVPRFGATGRTGSRRTLERFTGALHRRGKEATTVRRARSSSEELALVAAVLVFASSFIHSNMLGPHFEEYWLFGVFFAVATTLQAIWTVLIYGSPLNRRLLVAGAVGSGALVLIWFVSRSSGLPFGPQPWVPEPVGVVDVIATLDELVALLLIAIVLAALRGRSRPAISHTQLRVASMLCGPLFIFSVMASLGGGHHH